MRGESAPGVERVAALAASSPMAHAGASLYRSHVQLILSGVDAARNRAATAMASGAVGGHTYTTVEDTLAFIYAHRPKVRSYDEALLAVRVDEVYR